MVTPPPSPPSGTSSTTLTSTSEAKISNSPYYLHPSDHPHQVLTPILLNGDNYERWAKLARNNLRAKKKLGLIDGSLPRPATTSADYEQWATANSMLIGWLYASIDPKIHQSISVVDNAWVMWESLRARFSAGNAPRVHQLKADIAACQQTGQDVATYFGKLKFMWDDLDDYEPEIGCCCTNPTCEISLQHRKRRDHERIHQFLMGLDASRFGTTRTNLLGRLTREKDLTLDHIYSELIAEERHLMVSRSKEERMEAVSLAVQSGVNAIASVTRTRNNLLCTHCGRTNHTVDKCFLLHGYPEGWGRGRGNNNSNRGRGRGTSAPPRANNVVAANDVESSGIPGVSKETLAAIVNLLKPSTSSSETLSGKNTSVDFLIDSGASHHMTGDEDLLTDVYDIPSSIVVLPNGKHSYATKEGSLHLSSDRILTHVLYIPDLSCTLISLARLLREHSCFAIFTDKLCVIQDRSSKMPIGAGEEENGVYHFRGIVPVQANKTTMTDSLALWHQRMGHPGKKALSSVLSSFKDFDTSSSVYKDFCDICTLAKHTRDVFHDSSNKASECFSLIHCDVWGPYRTPSSSGAHYFLTIVDDHSRAVWTYLLLAKSEVSIVLQNFCSMAERQFGKQVKTVRSDNGTEFICLRKFFAEKGILHQTSCVGTPQQNGRVERRHRHILNVARSLLFQGKLPVKFWGESILTAVYLINRTPTPLLDDKTPYEILHKAPPSYTHLRVFGSLCFAKRQTATTDKFGPRSRRCVFVGYPHGQKGWRVFDIELREFFVSRDVIFHETTFPFISPSPPSSAVPSPRIEIFDENHPPLNTPPLTQPDDTPLQPNDRPEQPIDRSLQPIDRSLPPCPIVEPAIDRSSPLGPTVQPTIDRSPQQIDRSPRSQDSESSSLGSATPSDLDEYSPSPPDPPIDDMGKGKRQKFPSVLLKPYVTNSVTCDKDPILDQAHTNSAPSGTCFYPIANYVCSDRFSAKHAAFLAKITIEEEPVFYYDAVTKEVWRGAMRNEVDALEQNKTWSLTTLPPGKKALASKWVYRIKYNADGTIERHKARLVVMGNHQKEGIDYDDTFAPVVKMNTVRILLKLAAAKNWELHQMDVQNAFLHGDLDEEVYMRPPQGFKPSDPSLVCKLHKSLYGLKQAPRCWFAKLSTALLEYGFVQCRKDYSLFTRVRGSTVLHILIYVDDLVIAGNDSAVIAQFKEYLHSCFRMKDLGALKYFLGIEVSRGPDGIYLSQRKYCLDIISECGLTAGRPVDTPMEQNHKLASDNGPLYDNPSQYRRLIGRLVYLAVTRPELSYTVHILAQFMKTPRQAHWEAALRTVHYLKGCPGQGIVLSSNPDLQVTAYSDSDYSSCPLTRRSLNSYVVMLGDSPVSWKTKKQDKVSRSSTEAEYRSMAYTTQELLWMKELLHSLGVPHTSPMKLVCDNKSALYIAANPVFHERTKHIENDCHFIRDEIINGTIATTHVCTTEQLADILTKALGGPQFRYLLGKLGVCDLHAPT